jgi:hypothetical protein
MAPIGARHTEELLANHHASGVATSSSKIVVTLANWQVSTMAFQSWALKVIART